MPKRILILGGSGMLGHKLYQTASNKYDTYVSFRKFSKELRNTGIFERSKIIDHFDAHNIKKVRETIDKVEPQYIINCIGIIKQKRLIDDPSIAIYINALFPHLLADICKETGTKLIHISTDCVFSGKKGNYTEEDISDADDVYGKTKYLGEIANQRNLTIRTSIIGRELFAHYSLADWLISNKNREVYGYKNAIYTGLSSIALSNEIVRIMKIYPHLHGLYQISSAKISKFDLLVLINKVFNLNIHIVPSDEYFCDRSLTSTKYKEKTNYHPYDWEEMISEMFTDKTNYERWEIQ